LAMMQAYIDESASQKGERMLWMAGYLNSASNWALFSEAWDEELRQAPAINYLKMSEALFFKGEFRGWTAAERDEKLRGLARVIRHFRPASFGMAISLAQFDAWVCGLNPFGLDAHYVVANLVIAKVADYSSTRGMVPPIDFFFDQHDGLEPSVRLFLDAMVEGMPKPHRKWVGQALFKDEKEVLPIQAADMLAWYLRRRSEGSNSDFLLVDLPDIAGVEHFETIVPEAAIKGWGEAFAKMPAEAMSRTPAQWKRLKKELTAIKSKGFEPPYGTPMRNWIGRNARWLARLLGYPVPPNI
jgi:hypothetical protein